MYRSTRRLFVAAASLVLAASFGLGATPVTAQEVTLKLHQFLPAQANVPKHVLAVWADKIEKDSGGRIKIEQYPSMQLGGKPPELIDQAIDGVADIIWSIPGYTPGRFPTTEVFELPFMMTNAEATSRAYWDMFEKHMKDGEMKDFHVLAVWVHGPGLIHSKTPVTKLEDLNGLKLRSPTRVTNLMFSKLGATAVGMPVPAVPEALSKGVIDATVIPWEVTAALKVPELVTNHTDFGSETLYTTAFFFAMNKAKYDSLPDDLKKIIDDNSGAELSAFAGKTMQEDDGPSKEMAVKRGNNLITLPPEEVARWKDAAQPVIDEWVADMNSKGMDGKGLLEEARSLIAKYTK